MRVRRATEVDIGAIRSVARQTWAFAYRDLIPNWADLVGHWYTDASLRSRMERGVLLVATEVAGEGVVGFIHLVPNRRVPGEVGLAAIYVLPEYERRGIGTRLLHAGLEAIPDARRVVVHVQHGNALGMGFYAARGFRAVREFDDDVGGGYPLRMVEMAVDVPASTG